MKKNWYLCRKCKIKKKDLLHYFRTKKPATLFNKIIFCYGFERVINCSLTFLTAWNTTLNCYWGSTLTTRKYCWTFFFKWHNSNKGPSPFIVSRLKKEKLTIYPPNFREIERTANVLFVTFFTIRILNFFSIVLECFKVHSPFSALSFWGGW